MDLTSADLVSREQFLRELARVDHAGEFAAELFYRGQLGAMSPDDRCYEAVAAMYEQERQHCDFFNKMLSEQDSSPTIMLPLWRYLAYGLGYLGMRLGEQYGMLCTAVIEEVVDDLYCEQLRFLSIFEESELLGKIKDFRRDEMRHKEVALRSGCAGGILGGLFSKMVQTGCRCAIKISKKL